MHCALGTYNTTYITLSSSEESSSSDESDDDVTVIEPVTPSDGSGTTLTGRVATSTLSLPSPVSAFQSPMGRGSESVQQGKKDAVPVSGGVMNLEKQDSNKVGFSR